MPPRLQIGKNHGGTKSALFTNEHFRLFQVLFVEVAYAGYIYIIRTNLNFDSWSTKATVLAYGQTGSGKTYTMVWLPTNAEVVWACYHQKKEGKLPTCSFLISVFPTSKMWLLSHIANIQWFVDVIMVSTVHPTQVASKLFRWDSPLLTEHMICLASIAALVHDPLSSRLYTPSI